MPDTNAVDIRELGDLTVPWCLHVAATLRIADHVAEGKTSVADIAAACGADADVLNRVLLRLVQRGVFEETAPGRYSLNDAARQLQDEGTRLFMDLDGVGGRFAKSWTTLLSYVRTGKCAYHEAFGVGFWDDLNAHPEMHAQFDDLMGIVGHGTPEATFELAGGWDEVRTMVDVGGGTGAMLAELLNVHPNLRGILVDFPDTVSRSSEVFEAAGVGDRASAVGQSFFDPLPAGADLYLLKGVLHDWPDTETVAILRRCAEAAASSNGRVVTLSGVMAGGRPEPISISDVVTGGRTNTLPEFRALAAQAGLQVVAASRQGRYFVVECARGGA